MLDTLSAQVHIRLKWCVFRHIFRYNLSHNFSHNFLFELIIIWWWYHCIVVSVTFKIWLHKILHFLDMRCNKVQAPFPPLCFCSIYRVSEPYWTQGNVNKILIIQFSNKIKLSLCQWGQAYVIFKLLNRSHSTVTWNCHWSFWCTSQPWACHPWRPDHFLVRELNKVTHNLLELTQVTGLDSLDLLVTDAPEEVVTQGLVRAMCRPYDLRVPEITWVLDTDTNRQLLPGPLEQKINIQTEKCKILSCAQTVQDDE